MNKKQKQAIEIINNLRYHNGGALINDEEYFLLLEFVIQYPDKIVTVRKVLDESRPFDFPQINVPITTVYGCPIPDSMSSYSSTKTDNSNKV